MIGQRALDGHWPLLLLIAGLAGCGGEAADGSSAGAAGLAATGAPITMEVPESAIGDPAQFDESFALSFRDSCISAATDAGSPQAMAQTVCDCGVAELNKQYSAIEKARLTTDQLRAVMEQCADKVLKTNG